MRRRPRKKAYDIVPFLVGKQSYIDKVLSVEGASLVGFWPQNEQGGSVAFDKSPHLHNGAYTTATPGVAGIAPGLTAVLFDKTNDYNNIYSAGLANDNLLDNPGFETAGEGDDDVWDIWTESKGDGALANEAAGQYEGADAAKMTAGPSANTTLYQVATVVSGKRYRFRFWTKGDGTYDGRYQVWDNDNSADIIVTTNTGVTAGTYAMVAVTFVAPANCTSARMTFRCPDTNTAVAYFDACEVRSMDGFLGDEGTVLGWGKVSAVGVWTDSTARYIIRIYADASNNIYLQRTTANNEFKFARTGGGIGNNQNTGGLSRLDYVCYAMTWSAVADRQIYYIDGVTSGSADTGLGTWVGDLNSVVVCIGAANTTPGNVWDGSIGPVALWNKALTADQIAHLSKV